MRNFVFDICVVGHITKDIIVIGNKKKELPGGVVYYFSLALKSLDPHLKVAVVTKLRKEDKFLLNELLQKGVYVILKDSENTTIFENIYPENLSYRIQKVRSIADPFTSEDLSGISAKIFHLGPLTRKDIPIEVIEYLSQKAKLSVDIQGFVREVKEGRVEEVLWEEKENALSYIDILKANEVEAKILTKAKDVKEAGKILLEYGIKEVIITMGEKGSLIFTENKVFKIPAYPPAREVDVTGCGDTYMAGYIYKRLKSYDIEFAGKFAGATASLKVENLGAFKKSKEDVYQVLKNYEDLK